MRCLLEDECGQFFWGEQFVCNFLNVFGSDLVDALVEVGDVFFPSVMQETLAKIEGKLFVIITGDGNLAL